MNIDKNKPAETLKVEHFPLLVNQPKVLKQLGWDGVFEKHFQSLRVAGSLPARVSSQHRYYYQVCTYQGVLQAEVSGKLRHQAEWTGHYPVVGDWVALEPLPDKSRGIIHAILPRKTRFSRQGSGGRGKLSGGQTREQVVAANVDTVLIIGALDEGRSINTRRFERYLTLVWASGANPVIILNKSDLCADVVSYVRGVEPAVAGVPVHAVSALQRTGLDALRSYLTPGKTVALLGPSGVGKSALVNALLGEERQETGEVRERDRTGRHTTSARELILVPGGGVIIDTPGMREIQMWADEDDLTGSFEDIEALARRCQFNDCKHDTEPGCAVKAAIESGNLDAARLGNFTKLQREVQFHEARQGDNERRLEKEKWKKISQAQRTRRDG